MRCGRWRSARRSLRMEERDGGRRWDGLSGIWPLLAHDLHWAVKKSDVRRQLRAAVPLFSKTG